jgi:hypothetical protein
MNHEIERPEWNCIDAALEAACEGWPIEYEDQSFGYEYGSISATHRCGGYVVEAPSYLDVRIKIDGGAGAHCWMPGDGPDGHLRVHLSHGISVDLELESLSVVKRDGWWLVDATFKVEVPNV